MIIFAIIGCIFSILILVCVLGDEDRKTDLHSLLIVASSFILFMSSLIFAIVHDVTKNDLRTQINYEHAYRAAFNIQQPVTAIIKDNPDGTKSLIYKDNTRKEVNRD